MSGTSTNKRVEVLSRNNPESGRNAFVQMPPSDRRVLRPDGCSVGIMDDPASISVALQAGLVLVEALQIGLCLRYA